MKQHLYILSFSFILITFSSNIQANDAKEAGRVAREHYENLKDKATPVYEDLKEKTTPVIDKVITDSKSFFEGFMENSDK